MLNTSKHVSQNDTKTYIKNLPHTNTSLNMLYSNARKYKQLQRNITSYKTLALKSLS
jgi:hypothetical protein